MRTPHFPIVSITVNGIVEYHRSMKDFSRPPKSLLRGNYFQSMKIFDTKGGEFGINNFFIQDQGMLSLFRSRANVELTFLDRGLRNIEVIKMELIRGIDMHPDFWDSSGELTLLRQRIANFKTIDSLITTLCSEYYKQF